MGYSAVVVTYYPEKKHIKNIEKISKQVDYLFIVDNTDIEITFPKFPRNVSIIKNRKNYGIAYALNVGLKLSEKLNVNGVFLFDQDSSAYDTFVRDMILFKEKIKDEKVIMFSPNFFDINVKAYASFFKFTRFKIKRIKCGGIIYPTLVITSGSLLDIRALKEIGYFNEIYFLDLVDNEYCFRILEKGYKIAVNCNIVLKHAIGKREEKKILFLKIRPNNHPPFRKYYIIRNCIFNIKRFGKKYPSIVLWNLALITHTVLSVLFFEKEKRKKFLCIAKGLIDGLFFFPSGKTTLKEKC